MRNMRQCHQREAPSVKPRYVQTAIKLLIPGELLKRAVCEGTKALAKYDCAKGQPDPVSYAEYCNTYSDRRDK
jgi:hypothetical protein